MPTCWSRTIGATLIVAYLIFSDYAGQLADRFSKRSVLIATKSLEIVAMVSGLAAFFLGNITAMIVVLFFMGAQAALYSPAKYGCLPELLPDRDLSRGNALIEMSTFLAIIIGGVARRHHLRGVPRQAADHRRHRARHRDRRAPPAPSASAARRRPRTAQRVLLEPGRRLSLSACASSIATGACG